MNSYELRVRAFEKNDINLECKFMPDHENFQMYLGALIEDISSLEQIAKAENCGSYIIIETQTEVDDCKAILMPIFSSYICKIRCVSITKI